MSQAIDGGAGAGHTASRMLEHLTDGTVYAFEPFPGNHRFFDKTDSRVVLIKKALAAENRRMRFHVPSVVPAGSSWGDGSMEGYSSLGFLVDDRDADEVVETIEVEAVRADDVIDRAVDFVKLDLQGGELDALRGMSGLLSQVSLMWVEYTGQEGLLDYLSEQGFLVYDTEYFLWGEPSDRARRMFHVSREGVPLSTGQTTWTGFKKTRWQGFEEQFHEFKREISLGETDFVCVNSRYIDSFLAAAQLI